MCYNILKYRGRKNFGPLDTKGDIAIMDCNYFPYGFKQGAVMEITDDEYEMIKDY